MLSDLQLVYMVPRKSTQLLNINTTKFQVDREPVYMDGVKLSTIKEEKDLGVLITDDLKPSVQCTDGLKLLGKLCLH